MRYTRGGRILLQWATSEPGVVSGRSIWEIPVERLSGLRRLRHQGALWQVLSLPLLVLAGCGPGRIEDRGEVRGTVRLDGELLAEGSILFQPTGGNSGPVAGGTIQDGTFYIRAEKGPPIGMNRIEINAVKKTGRNIPAPPPGSGMIEELVEAVPKEYNQQSTLQWDIKQGENVIDLDLDSTP